MHILQPTRRRAPGVRLGIVALVAALAGCSDESSGGSGQAAPPPPSVTVAKPVVRDIVEADEFVGRFEALEAVDVRARVSGYLSAIHFTDGSLVEAGEPLFTIDQRPFHAELDQADAELRSAEAVVEFTKDDLARAESLLARGNITQQIVDQRRQEYRIAEANVAAAKSAKVRAGLDLAYTEITAPISGRIDERRVSTGNLVEANQTVLTTIVSLDPIYFYFDIDERSFLAYARDARARGASLQEGAGSVPVSVELADNREEPRQGVLDFASNRIDDATGTMRVRAVFPNPDGVLQPGLFGRVTIPGSLPYRGVLVPDEAIASDQNRRIVYLVDEVGAVSPREVRPGPRIDGYRVIREGLSGNETIVINGLMRVRPGVTVTPELAELPPTRD